MQLFSSLRTRLTGQSQTRRTPARKPTLRFRPRFEALENRRVLAQVGLTVTSLADTGPGTLRAAIVAADAGSHSDKFTIGFGVSGTIDLQSPLPVLNNNIAIQGPGATSLTVEQAVGSSFLGPIFLVDAGGPVNLSGLTLANSTEGIINYGNLTLANSAILNNHLPDPYGGGGIYNHGTLAISGSTISGNSAGGGGGIENDFFGTLMISNSILNGNSASDNGGGIDNNGTLTVIGSTLSANSALFGGGISNFGSLTVSASTLSGNSAINSPGVGSGEGGGILNEGTLTVSTSTLTSNFAAHAGGGIFTIGTTVTVMGGSISGNHAAGGGGISNSGGALSVSGCSLSANSADEGGGAIVNFDTMTVSGCTFAGNSATGIDINGHHSAGQGGGIFNGGAATIRDSLFSSNSAELGGAIYSAIFNDIQALGVRGSTFSGNSASNSGGAIDNERGTATIQESTLSGNTAGLGGGGIFNDTLASLAVKDSTVLDNIAALDAEIENLGALTLNDSVVGP